MQEEEVIKDAIPDKENQMEINFDNLKELGLGFKDDEIDNLKKQFAKPNDSKENKNDTDEHKETKAESKKEKPANEEQNKTDNPFLIDIDDNNESKKSIENKDDLLEVLNSNGLSVKSLDDVAKFASDYKSSIEKISELEKNQKEGEIAIDILNKMPDDILDLVQSWANNEDYKSKMKDYASKTIDFSIDFEKQDIRSILAYYAPKSKLFDIEDNNELKQELIDNGMYDTLKKSYNSDVKESVSIRDKIVKESEAKNKLIVESVKRSIDNISKVYPDIKFSEKHNEEVLSILNKGANGVLELFLNKDGSFKEDAAAIIAMAKYGYSAINDLKQMIRKRAESEVTEDFITRGKKTPESGNKEFKSSEVDMKKIDNLANEILGIKQKSTSL